MPSWLRASRELAEVERWPRERVEHLQRERLDAIARHASEHSPFWRERLPRGRVELSALPILTKSQMMERRLADRGKEVRGTPIDELEALWQEAKR